MRVIWMPNAKMAVRETAKYIRKELGKRDRDNFMRDVRLLTQRIRATLIARIPSFLEWAVAHARLEPLDKGRL